jgi:hypothetical protein
VGRSIDDRTFKQAWSELEEAGQIAHIDRRWVAVVVDTPPDRGDHQLPAGSSSAGLCDACGRLLATVAGRPHCLGCNSGFAPAGASSHESV